MIKPKPHFIKPNLHKKRASVSDICPPPLLPLTKTDIKKGSENDRVGVVRDTMFQNHLILKPELGRTRRWCVKLPGSNFVYGLSLHGTDGGVPEAIGRWDVMPPTFVKEKEQPLDYSVMHKKAIKAGLITVQEHDLYRQYHEARRKGETANRFPKNVPHRPDDTTYGRPYRAPTPIVDVLQHKFAELWLEEQRKAVKVVEGKKRKKKRRGKTYETRTVLLRKYQPPIKPEPLWHMPRFAKVAPHLDTFSTRKERVDAFEAQKIEVPVRSGSIAQGIYTHL